MVTPAPRRRPTSRKPTLAYTRMARWFHAAVASMMLCRPSMVKPQSSVSRVASVPSPRPRRSPRWIPNSAVPLRWSIRASVLQPIGGLLGAVVDGEVQAVGHAAAAGDAVALGLQREGHDPAVAVGHLQIVLPALVGRDQVQPQRPQRHPLALDHEPRLLIHLDRPRR